MNSADISSISLSSSDGERAGVRGSANSNVSLRLGALLQLCLLLAGCASTPESAPSSRQQAEADLVVYFQSWNSISFIKPDLLGTVGVPTVRQKTFTRAAIEK